MTLDTFTPENLPQDRPVLIAGPTASGKSALALALAHAKESVIINADALQVYREWSVLTARPDAAETARAPHRLYGHVGLLQDYSVGAWLKEVAREVKTAQAQNLRPIIIGGTGLYFRALTEGLADIPPIPEAIRQEATATEVETLSGQLAQEDPVSWSRIDQLNPVRIRRAWEVLRTTGRGIADWQDNTPAPLLPIAACEALLLTCDKDWLNARIDQRFDQMVEMGALDECRAVLDQNLWDPDHPSCQAIGAKELIGHLEGAISLDAAITASKIQTHRYAKRQRTWFRARMKAWRPLTISTEGIKIQVKL